MMDRSVRWVLAVTAMTLSGAALSGCNEQGYLFYREPVPAKRSDVAHKLKQLQGNSVVDIIWVIDNSGSMGRWFRPMVFI